MGIEKIQKITLKYRPEQIEEKKEVWDDLEEKKKEGVIEDWELSGTENKPTAQDRDD